MIFLSPDFWRGLIALVYGSVALLIVIGVIVAIWKSNPTNKWTWAWVPVTVIALAYPPVSAIVGKWMDEREFAAKSAAQIAHFEMRCKSAGEFIHQTVKGVDGIFIMKPRIVPTETLYQSQFELWDPYGTSGSEADDPQIFLKDEVFEGYRQRGIQIQTLRGFRFLEMAKPKDISDSSKGKFVRYTFQRISKDEIVRKDDSWKSRVVITTVTDELQSQFGYTWDDISTVEDREKWIAGGRMRVVDLSTNKIIAERIGYMREPGIGSLRHNRAAWSFANSYSCPNHLTEYHKDFPFLRKVFPQ